MELFIDGLRADMDRRAALSVSLSVSSLTSPEYGRTGYTKSISVPMTAANRSIMGDCEQVNARDRFNSALHKARIEHEGCVVMEGSIMLTACEKEGEGGRYVFNIIGAAKRWASHAVQNPFSTLFPGYSMRVGPAQIAASWTEAVPVRWLPVQREPYVSRTSSTGVYPLGRTMSATDYHPFIHLRSVMHAIFEDAGYELVSDFIDSAYFDTFYMSGAYRRRDAELLRRRMDFAASRFGEVSATADASGRVFANPLTTYNTVGNIVETADPDEERDGVKAKGVFDNGGCFRREGERVAFFPHYSVAAGFEYKLTYISGYRIAGRSRLSGFDRIYLGGGRIHDFRIANPFKDRREEFRFGKEFNCIVCDHEEGAEYRLVADRRINAAANPDAGLNENYTISTLVQFFSRSIKFSASAEGTYKNLRMQKRRGTGAFTDFTGEWALYDGYVTETGTIRVEVVLRSAAEVLTPGKPKYFDTIYFAGAEAGMPFTLESARVRPVFQTHPALGDEVSFADVGAHDMNRMKAVKAVRDMFGLCFYTDDLDMKVYAEPRALFYRDDVVVDRSDCVDLSKPISHSELAVEMPDTLIWEYLPGDGASADYNVAHGGHIGRWSAKVGNPWREGQTKTYCNSIFTTTVNMTGVVPSAASASLPAAGSMATDSADGVEDLNFPVKVVRYPGMKTLPEGEFWGWPSFGNTYPLAAFHLEQPLEDIARPVSPCGAVSALEVKEETGRGFTLCYEDRDGLPGLHRWWDGLVDTCSHGVRLEVWLHLYPEDIEVLIRPNYLRQDFRARFRLHIDGEWNDWRLEEVCDYDPSAPSTKCIFTKIV